MKDSGKKSKKNLDIKPINNGNHLFSQVYKGLIEKLTKDIELKEIAYEMMIKSQYKAMHIRDLENLRDYLLYSTDCGSARGEVVREKMQIMLDRLLNIRQNEL